MKKVKGIAHVGYPSSYAVGYEDQRLMFKHQSLMQDYDDLQKETEATRVKLEKTKRRNSKLLAEVCFLRRRYEFLMKNQSVNMHHEMRLLQPQHLGTRGKDVAKERNCRRNGSILRPQAPVFDLSHKEKVPNVGIAAVKNPVPIFDLNQKELTLRKKKVAKQTSVPMFDLNQNERLYEGKEASLQNVAPVFDLNQISMEQLQANNDPLSIEEPKINSVKAGADEQMKDMNVLVCRNIDGSKQGGKRKVTWQDQVALRV